MKAHPQRDDVRIRTVLRHEYGDKDRQLVEFSGRKQVVRKLDQQLLVEAPNVDCAALDLLQSGLH